MSKAMHLAKLLEGWCDSVKFQAKKMAMSGQQIEGFVLRDGKQKRTVDVKQVYGMIDKSDLDEFFGCCKVSIPKLKKMFHKDDFKEHIEPIIQSERGDGYLQKERKV